jgi:catechol 2,3-dioxygenase-like lactoylglutathione lyase family enzyme
MAPPGSAPGWRPPGMRVSPPVVTVGTYCRSVSLKIDGITFNTPDPRALADWWVEALGGRITAEYPEYVFIEAGHVNLGFQRAQDAPTNTVHVDLSAADRVAEVKRLVGLGARVESEREVAGGEWTVLIDPDGNRFCVVQRH